MADLNEKFNEFNNTPDTTNEYDSSDIGGNKGMAVLAYLSWLVLIPLFLSKNSKFVRFHVNQGFSLAVIELICYIGLRIFSKIKFIGWIFSLSWYVASILFLVLMIIGIVNAANGRAKELPLIGKMRIINY